MLLLLLPLYVCGIAKGIRIRNSSRTYGGGDVEGERVLLLDFGVGGLEFRIKNVPEISDI